VLRTADQYIASLRDKRSVFYRGERVDDVTQHSAIRPAIDHAAIDYRMAEDPRWRDLAVVDSSSRFFVVPHSADDLLARSRLIEAATREGGTLVVLIKEIGTDALFALTLLAERLGGEYPKRVSEFLAHCRTNDLAMAVAQTDAKGDRTKRPSEQANLDSHVRVVARRSDGIVVRGTKCHTSVSVNANELIILPTREMTEADAAFAVAFAVPIDTPGLSLVASPYLDSEGRHPFEHPISAHHKMVESTTVFEDVFVPWERVFLCGEWSQAGRLAREFVEFHRFTAVSYKLPLVDALLGSALVAAEMAGIQRVGHVRDKLAWLVTYAATLRELTHHAASMCRIEGAFDLAVPDTLVVNLAKLHFAQNFHNALMLVQDIAGGLTVTGPSFEDFQHPTLGPILDRALAGAGGSSGIERMKVINLVSELTTSDFGGYQAVLAVHAEGSIEAEKLAMVRAYDWSSARDYALRLAGVT